MSCMGGVILSYSKLQVTHNEVQRILQPKSILPSAELSRFQAALDSELPLTNSLVQQLGWRERYIFQ